ncbi:galectin-12 isoform X4 [Malaclemys terrapin pileata]|uniref:galectin-12 isoform X4 n=1 Tax=Malaclemys terrapin pileata TaxID=2991368 RepID=UPI0023A7AA69|nr:galectin-12 isoform X4 [Malaclemys terrapin pileata]
MGPTSPVDFILQPPVFHPVLPYITTIFGGLTRGKMVLVQGVVFAEAERFQVDFQCGCSVMPRPDIAIHFNPRFRSRPHVICNTLQNGRWLEETKFPHLPLKRGEAFQLLFLFGQDEVQVSVNGQHFLQYRSRLPLARVDTVGVFGDIMVKSMAFLRSNPFDASRTEYPVAHVSPAERLSTNPMGRRVFPCSAPSIIGTSSSLPPMRQPWSVCRGRWLRFSRAPGDVEGVPGHRHSQQGLIVEAALVALKISQCS